jgi:glutathione S-transferase
MREFIVHSIAGSPFGRAVLAALEEKGASYRLAPVASGTFRSPEHLARHPFGRVPVLDHGDFRLYETQAILRYLDRVLPVPALTPSDPQRAARMDQLMNVNDWYLFQGVGSVIGFNRIIKPRLMGVPPDEEAIKAAIPKAHVVFNELARRWASSLISRAMPCRLRISCSRRRSSCLVRRRSGPKLALLTQISSGGLRACKPGLACKRQPGSASRNSPRRRDKPVPEVSRVP